MLSKMNWSIYKIVFTRDVPRETSCLLRRVSQTLKQIRPPGQLIRTDSACMMAADRLVLEAESHGLTQHIRSLGEWRDIPSS